MTARTRNDRSRELLREIVGDAGIVPAAGMAAYERGARYGSGEAACVVRPATAEEVSRVVALCAREHIRLVPQGANTGLVGASTPDASGAMIVLSLERVKREWRLDAANRSVSAGAGLRLHELNERLRPHDLWFPVDLGADPTLGGMVASNTGGTRLIRYGDVRHNLLALEAVLLEPPGEIVHFGKPLRKDNTGLDLKQLLVGASGATGVVTEVTLEVYPRPRQSATALVVPASDGAVTSLLTELEGELGDFLAAFEGMSRAAMQVAIDHVPGARNPFAPEPLPEFAVLVELESVTPVGRGGLDLQQLLGDFLEERFGREIVTAVLGNGEELWQLRHSISEGARQVGALLALDVSVPRAQVMEFRRVARSWIAQHHPRLEVIDFGHLADGGLHFNLAWPRDAGEPDPEVTQVIRKEIYQLVVRQFGGSFSAEHGIGPYNQDFYRQYTPRSTLRLSGAIQRLLNPRSLCGTVQFGNESEAVFHT